MVAFNSGINSNFHLCTQYFPSAWTVSEYWFKAFIIHHVKSAKKTAYGCPFAHRTVTGKKSCTGQIYTVQYFCIQRLFEVWIQNEHRTHNTRSCKNIFIKCIQTVSLLKKWDDFITYREGTCLSQTTYFSKCLWILYLKLGFQSIHYSMIQFWIRCKECRVKLHEYRCVYKTFAYRHFTLRLWYLLVAWRY